MYVFEKYRTIFLKQSPLYCASIGYIPNLSVDAVKLSEIAFGKQNIEETFYFDILVEIKEVFSNGAC